MIIVSKIREFFENQPLLTSILIVGIYWAFLFLIVFIRGLIYSLPLPLFIWLQFVVYNAVLSFLWLYFIPILLEFPIKHQTFTEYLTEIRIDQVNPWKRNLLLGTLFALIILFSTLMANIIAGDYIFDLNKIFGQPEPGNDGYLTFIYNLIPAIWEEIAFRGVIMVILVKKYSTKKAVILDGLLFGFFHLINFLVGGGDFLFTIGQIFSTSCIGFVLSYMYIKTESLLPPMIAHYLNNAFQPLVSNAVIANMALAVVAQIIMVLIFLHLGLLLVYLMTKREENKE
ncbi:MAG: membrane protein of unknown function [Promethearchaeota archaeon]|nr:MAG: membrane protein of unknown function [Candidatus Lokiarchaeota archaeon]